MIAAFAPAPIKDTRPLVVQPESSDAVRTQQQTAARMGEVGVVPDVTDRQSVPNLVGSSDAADVVAGATRADDKALANARKGAAAVKAASQELEAEKKAGWGKYLMALLVLVAAFGIFQAFKAWANKNLPDAPKSYR